MYFYDNITNQYICNNTNSNSSTIVELFVHKKYPSFSLKDNAFEQKVQPVLRRECWFYISKIICLFVKYSLLTAM